MRVEDHMLGYNGYLHARELTTTFGEPVLLLAALASAALIAVSIFYLLKKEKKSDN